MLTAENFSANLRTARRVVGERLGVDPAKLTFEQRTQYNKALAAYIAQFPGSFSPQSLEIARRILEQPDYEALQDTSLDLGAFVEQYTSDVKEKVLPVAKWLTFAAVAVLGIWLLLQAATAKQIALKKTTVRGIVLASEKQPNRPQRRNERKKMSMITFTEAVNWEYVNSHHSIERDGRVKPGPWVESIIAHARRNGYRGKITNRGASRIINRNLYR